MDFKKLVGEGTITSKLKWVIVGLALLTETVLTAQTIMRHVDDPAMRIIAVAGVSMLALSLLILPRQLFNGDIKYGAHRSVAISVLIVELLVMTVNLIVALSDALVGWMLLYAQYVLPATPAIVVAGQFLIWMFDPMDRAKVEQDQAEQAERVMETRFRTEIHVKKMEYAKTFLNSEQFQKQIADWAENTTQQTLSTLARTPSTPLPTPVRTKPTTEDWVTIAPSSEYVNGNGNYPKNR